MEVLYILIPVSICAAAIALLGFIWAVNSGQYDDLDTPPQQLVFESDSHF